MATSGASGLPCGLVRNCLMFRFLMAGISILTSRKGQFRGWQSHHAGCRPLLPLHHDPLQPRLRIIPPRPLIKDGDAKTRAGIAVRASQPKLQIEDKRIRGNPLTALQQPLTTLDASPARAAHHNHLMPGQIAQPQPPNWFSRRKALRKF